MVRREGGGERLGGGGQGGGEGGGEAEEGRRGERGEELGMEAVEEGLVKEDTDWEGRRGGWGADGGEDRGQEGGVAVHEGWGWGGIEREGEGEGTCLHGEEFAAHVQLLHCATPASSPSSAGAGGVGFHRCSHGLTLPALRNNRPPLSQIGRAHV